MIQNNFIKWLKLSITLFCLILILIGFALGYIYNNYNNGACSERPLSYAIEKLNDMNNANFTCSCNSIGVEPFSFNEYGLVSDDLFIISP